MYTQHIKGYCVGGEKSMKKSYAPTVMTQFKQPVYKSTYEITIISRRKKCMF